MHAIHYLSFLRLSPVKLEDARELKQTCQSLPVDIAYNYAENVIKITFTNVHLTIAVQHRRQHGTSVIQKDARACSCTPYKIYPMFIQLTCGIAELCACDNV